ncbi:MAG: beta-lactamase family protein [Acholeplasmataceae bacterium]|nr:beta-lactamase family protein [Acholeplasmataceae bacterium]
MNSYAMENKLNKKLLLVINRYLEKKHSQLSFAVIYNDESWILNFNQDDQMKVDVKNDRYDIGSISKIMTSLLVLHTINQKLLNLDDTIDKYLNLKKGHYPTIYQLLSHTYNYFYFTPIEIVLTSLFKKGYSRQNIYEKINHAHVLKALERRRMRNTKGKYGYSDFGYAALALTLEQVYNQPFYQLMNNFIKDHLKLQDTYCIDGSDIRVNCYLNNKKITNWRWLDDNPYIASGGISSTIEDMRKYLDLMLNSDDDIIKRSLTNFDDEKAHNVTFLLSKNRRVFWHVGGAGQFRSSLTLNPRRKIGVIVLGNSSGVISGNVHYISKMIYNDIRRNRLFEKEDRTNKNDS